MAALMDKNALDSFQADLRVISAEARKRFPAVKDAAERGILQLRAVASSVDKSTPFNKAVANHDQIPHAFILGCQTKSPALAQKSLQSLNRLVMYNACSTATLEATLDSMEVLLAEQMEPIRVCQTVNAMLSSSDLVRGDTLAKTAQLSFKLHAYKDPMISNTAAAALMQLVSVLFDRVAEEEAVAALIEQQNKGLSEDTNKAQPLPLITHEHAPCAMLRCAMDAFLFTQDLFQIINGDDPLWLGGLPNPKPIMYCLELVHTALSSHPQTFITNPNFGQIVKERMCPIVIKSFSPSKRGDTAEGKQRVSYSTTQRLLRIVSVLIKNFQSTLVTESEIFLTMLVKFLHSDWPTWQQTLAIEVLRDLSAHPKLIRQYCECYDMQEHSAPVFSMIVAGVTKYIQTEVKTDAQTAYQNPSAGSNRYLLLDSLEKSEPPLIPAKYAASIAVSCVIDLANAVIITSDQAIQVDMKPANGTDTKDSFEELVRCMIGGSWSHILDALSIVLHKSSDEKMDKRVLMELERYTTVCGRHNINDARDSFLAMLCQQMLLTLTPPKKSPSSPSTLRREESTILKQTISPKNIRASQALLGVVRTLGNTLGASWYIILEALQQLFYNVHQHDSGRMPRGSITSTWEGAPSHLSKLAQSTNMPFVESKHLSDKALADLIHNLCTLSTNGLSTGSYRPGAKIFGIPRLFLIAECNLQRISYVWPLVVPHLLTACQSSNTDARLCAIEAYTKLCQILLEAEDQASGDGSVVSSKLQEDIFKCLKVAGEGYADTKSKQLEALLFLLQSFGQSLTLAWPYVFAMLSSNLAPPARASSVPEDPTVPEDQSETAVDPTRDPQHQSNDDNSDGGASINVANNVANSITVANTRLAFESLQLVVADFLGVLPVHCLHACIDAVGVFGTQQLDINISLTAVGLLWNIADYLHRERETLCSTTGTDDRDNREVLLDLEIESATLNGPMDGYKERLRAMALDCVRVSGNALWTTLFAALGDLCVDRRPEVRKSGNQTLFGTMTMHGADFSSAVWHISLWAVMFPLLKNVKDGLQDVKDRENDTSKDHPTEEGPIIVHHSRNTAVKQWDETTVISLDGVTQVLIVHHDIIHGLKEYVLTMKLLLEHIEYFACLDSHEVSMNAVTCLEKVMSIPVAEESIAQISFHDNDVLYRQMWSVWSRIAARQTPKLVKEDFESSGGLCELHLPYGVIPVPKLITKLAEIFRTLYIHLKATFYRDDLLQLFFVLKRMICIVSAPGTSTDVIDKRSAAALHTAVLTLVELLDPNDDEWPIILRELMTYPTFVFITPVHAGESTPETDEPKGNAAYMQLYFDSMSMLRTVYEPIADKESVVTHMIFKEIIAGLRVGMLKKYHVEPQTWRVAVSTLVAIARDTFPVQCRVLSEGKHTVESTTTFRAFFDLLDDYLFCDGDEELIDSPFIPPIEERHRDESLDLQLIGLVQDFCLPHIQYLPEELVNQIIMTLQRGSVLENTEVAFAHIQSEPDVDPHTGSLMVKEALATACFETLLEFSFLDQNGEEIGIGESAEPNSRSSTPADTRRETAMDVLIMRCDRVLQDFEAESRLSNCPLPRSKMSEVCFVLQSVGCLVDSLIDKRRKRAGSDNSLDDECAIETRQHEQALFEVLYPRLVDCIDTTDGSVRLGLKDVLKRIGSLVSICCGQ